MAIFRIWWTIGWRGMLLCCFVPRYLGFQANRAANSPTNVYWYVSQRFVPRFSGFRANCSLATRATTPCADYI